MQGSSHRQGLTRALRASLIVAILVSVVAGCGGSSHGPTGPTAARTSTSASTDGSRGVSRGSAGPLAFSNCMRSNGVPSFPDLTGNGMKIAANGQSLSVNGITVNAPAFIAARQRCQHYLPHQNATPAQAAQQRQRGLEFATCMRSHGVPNYPDPKVISNSTGNQPVQVSAILLQSPAFQSAAKACGGGPKGP